MKRDIDCALSVVVIHCNRFEFLKESQALFVAIDRCCYIRGMVVENDRNDVPTLRKVLIARFVDMQI